MHRYKWDEKLDKELIDLYKVNRNAVSILANKYGISLDTIYYRLKKLGIRVKNKGSPKGEYSTRWKDGKYITKNGYVMIHVGRGIGCGGSGYIAEHILVMEKHLGRKLKKGEIPHHIDETFEGRSNNNISNLELMTKADHAKHHHTGAIHNLISDDELNNVVDFDCE